MARIRSSEFGGTGENAFDHALRDGFEVKPLRGSPVPHMERQALHEAIGGTEVLTDIDGTPLTEDPRYGLGGVNTRGYSDV